MQIVIELDKSIVKGIKAKDFEFARGAVRNFQATIADAIRNGTPLPKGHGRLIDADELANDDRVCNGISCSECPFENFREHSCRWCDFIKNYHAIIEADKESTDAT